MRKEMKKNFTVEEEGERKKGERNKVNQYPGMETG